MCGIIAYAESIIDDLVELCDWLDESMTSEHKISSTYSFEWYIYARWMLQICLLVILLYYLLTGNYYADVDAIWVWNEMNENMINEWFFEVLK